MFFNKHKNEISIKIGDLGLSKQINEDYLKTYVGKPFYVSPEMLNDQLQYTAKTDVWYYLKETPNVTTCPNCNLKNKNLKSSKF